MRGERVVSSLSCAATLLSAAVTRRHKRYLYALTLLLSYVFVHLLLRVRMTTLLLLLLL